ncbi:MAG: helix-turn-helix domain-containing protein [Sphingomonadaceae bacterium]
MAEIRVRYAFPDPKLFELVVAYLEISIAGTGPALDLLPPDIPALCFALSGEWAAGRDPHALTPFSAPSALFGPSISSRWLRAQSGTGFAIGLQPLAWPSLLDAKASDHANMVSRLCDMWGAHADDLRSQLAAAPDFDARVAIANHYLLSRITLPRTSELGAQIACVRAALSDPDCASVDDMTERVGISQSRLARLSKAYFGFAPKMLIKRERFRRMLHRMDAMSYANWRSYIEEQYVDQSHMIRDFNQFLGMAPTHYMALDRPIVTAAFETFRTMMGMQPQ